MAGAGDGLDDAGQGTGTDSTGGGSAPVGAGSLPAGARLAQAPASAAEGLSWCWELDLAAVIDAVTGSAPWLREPASDDGPPTRTTETPAAGSAPAGIPPAAGAAPAGAPPAGSAAAGGCPPAPVPEMEAEAAAYQEAVAAGRAREVPLELVAGRVAESLPAGPGLAGWLAQARAADLEDGALAGVAASFRRVASWAAAGELAAVAQIASRSARADRRAGVDRAGRPDRVTADAAGQVALALALSPDGAAGWADLAVVLTWRLAATGAALAAGQIDLARARMIARMTAALSDAAARAVEAAVLGRAGWLTPGQLYAALRRAVLRADPQGAERRRRQAERNARVALYPEDEGTATLAGHGLPGVQAAAAMARITALAKAMQAAGARACCSAPCPASRPHPAPRPKTRHQKIRPTRHPTSRRRMTRRRMTRRRISRRRMTRRRMTRRRMTRPTRCRMSRLTRRPTRRPTPGRMTRRTTCRHLMPGRCRGRPCRPSWPAGRPLWPGCSRPARAAGCST